MSRRVLVTGAAGGIGRSLVERLTRDGWQVAALDNRPLGPTPAGVLDVRADLVDADAVSVAAATVADRLGGLDGLVNNAAVTPARSPLEEQTGKRVAALLDVNVAGIVRLTQAVLPLLRAGDTPAVVNLSSVCATRAFRRSLGYVASKGAVEALTRALALDLSPLGVRVNAVAPGMVHTAEAWDGLPDDETARRGALVPLGRPARAEEVAAVVAFLLGPDSSYVTGAVLAVDGGLAAQAYAAGQEPGLPAVGDFPGEPSEERPTGAW